MPHGAATAAQLPHHVWREPPLATSFVLLDLTVSGFIEFQSVSGSSTATVSLGQMRCGIGARVNAPVAASTLFGPFAVAFLHQVLIASYSSGFSMTGRIRKIQLHPSRARLSTR